MSAPTMSAAEARTALAAFRAEVSAKAHIYVCISLDESGPPLRVHLNPKGILDRWTITAKGDDFAELLANIRTAWAENSEAHALKMVREMALAIISISDEMGECTDAALRARFDTAEVERYGEHACTAATEMAANGPFSIVKLAGANDAEAA